MYETLKFLHVVAMFTAVSAFVGGELYLVRVGSSRDVRGIRRIYEAGKKNDVIGIAAMILGIVFGFVTALNGDLDLTQTWLIMAYVLVAAILALGIGYWTPRAKRILDAATASPEDTASPELTALISRPLDRVLLAVDLSLWAGIVFVMVVKPLS